MSPLRTHCETSRLLRISVGKERLSPHFHPCQLAFLKSEELKIRVSQDHPQNIFGKLMQRIFGHDIVAVPRERRTIWIGRLANLNHSYILTDFRNDCQASFQRKSRTTQKRLVFTKYVFRSGDGAVSVSSKFTDWKPPRFSGGRKIRPRV